MNYTTEKQNVIFEIELSDFFGESSRRVYNKDTKESETKNYWIESVQDWEESAWENFESFYQYIDYDSIELYNDPEQATKYLLKKKYTKKEIDLFQDVLKSDIIRACSDAQDSSYQYEYNNKYYEMIMQSINEDLNDEIESNNIKYKLLDDITDKDFLSKKTDQKYLRLKISKKEIKEAQKKHYPEEKHHLDPDYIDYFNDYFLDFSFSPINTEYIDYHGTMGSYDDWLNCFKDYNEIEDQIIDYRKEEKEKKNNFIKLLENTDNELKEIKKYIDKYISKEPEKTKITRQLKALKSVIKNAV